MASYLELISLPKKIKQIKKLDLPHKKWEFGFEILAIYKKFMDILCQLNIRPK